MINSIVTNVVPPNVPSNRKGIAFYGQPEAVKQPQAQTAVKPQPKAPECKDCAPDKFVKQPSVKA